MVLGKKWLFLIGNGAEIRPLEMGRKGPDACIPNPKFMVMAKTSAFGIFMAEMSVAKMSGPKRPWSKCLSTLDHNPYLVDDYSWGATIQQKSALQYIAKPYLQYILHCGKAYYSSICQHVRN